MAGVADSLPMAHATDVDDAQLLRDRDLATLLAKYQPVVVGRCVARLHGSLDAEDVAQNVLVRLLAELDRGKTYSVPFRVVVHQVIGWTIQDYFAGRPTDLPLPEDWEPAVEGESDQVVSRYYLEDLLADLPGKTGEAMTLRYLRGYEPGEIAGELGIEPNAVYQLLHNGRNKLRETWTDG